MERPTKRPTRAVSPVIGVILLVAITVILSAVVGAMALGMGSDVDGNVRAAVDVECDPANEDIDVTMIDDRNADHVNVTLSSGSRDAHARLSTPGSQVVVEAGLTTVAMGGARVYDGGQWNETLGGGGGGGVGGGGGGGVGGGGGGGVGGGGGGGVGGGGGGGGGVGAVPIPEAPETGDSVTVTVVASTGDVDTTVVTDDCTL